MPSASLLKFCRGLPHATEDVKWEKDLVFSIGGKMFACFDTGRKGHVGFKTTPEKFQELIEKPWIIPAPYAARFHWVSLERAGALSEKKIKDFMSESYILVASKLPKRVRKQLGIFDEA